MKNIPFTPEELILHLIDCWRRFLKIPGPKDKLQTREFRTVSEKIQEMEKGISVYSRDHIAASLLYQFPLHFYEGLSLLKEFSKKPKRVLDFASGTAPLALAALINGAESVHALDNNEEALLLGADVIGRLGYTFTPHRWTYKTLKQLPFFPEPFDAILIGNSLHTLCPSLEEKLSLIQALSSLLSQEGSILIVDKTDMATMKWLFPLRRALMERNIHIKAPCISCNKCPAEEAKTFCFAQRPQEFPYMLKELQRTFGIFLRSLKMSYLLISKNAPTALPDNIFRVISPPIASHAGKRYFLCGKTGEKSFVDIPDTSSVQLSRGSVISYSEGVIKPLLKEDEPIEGVLWKKM